MSQEKGERGFHLFYQLLSTPPHSQLRWEYLDSIERKLRDPRRDLHLVSSSYRYLNESTDILSVDDEAELERTMVRHPLLILQRLSVQAHLSNLGMGEDDRMAIFQVRFSSECRVREFVFR